MSEVRLIDANALDFGVCRGGIIAGVMVADLNDVANVIKAAPIITPESLGYRKEVHGRWENTVKWWQGGSAWKRCSVCGIISEKTRYCRNCGARMDGEP